MADDSITSAEYAEWTFAPDAAKTLSREYSDASLGQSTLVRRLEAGLLRAVARTVVRPGAEQADLENALIKPSTWKRLPSGYDSHLWVSGDIDADFRPSGRYGELEEERWVSFFGIRFEPKGLALIHPAFTETPQNASDLPLPTSPIGGINAAPSSTKRPGAPRKGWWDDLWIEVMRRIADGRLHADTATSGSRLEYDLLDIAQTLGVFPGDSTLKPMALKLFKYLRENGGN